MAATGESELNDAAAAEKIEAFERFKELGLICQDGNFFPSVHYPPITMYPPIGEEALFSGYQNPPDGLFDIYAHLPFCVKQCTYCHYPVKLGKRIAEKDRYLNCLEKEMKIYMKRLGLNMLKARSILVGGGTPTFLSPLQLKRFLRFFAKRLDLSACTQFNYDLDPSSLLGKEGEERIQIMKSYGVNRLTIGVQSLDDSILKMMNRHHDATEAVRSVELAQAAGFVVNIEFIFGFPGQTAQNWIEVINKAISLQPDEIQLYRLKIEPYGDRIGKVKNAFSTHRMRFPSRRETIAMKQMAVTMLESRGYNENLTRVFSKDPGIYSHYADNQCCKLYDQIGFGLTAFSSLRDRFALNTQDFNEYYAKIEKGELPLNRGLVRQPEDQLRWAVILPLKNREVLKRFYQRQTGTSLNDVFRNKIARLKAHGLVIEDEKTLRLTRMGRFFADEVCQQFHQPRYMPFPQEAYARGELNPFLDNESGQLRQIN